MATTTNYGWTTPDDTGLVKDGASAIRSLGTSVDTTTKNLNPSTTLGDIEYRSSTANTNTRLGIGSSGQVLTVASGVPSWATPAAGGGMTLLSTTTTNGAGSYTLSSISQSYKTLVMVGVSVSKTNTASVRFYPQDGTTDLSLGYQWNCAGNESNELATYAIWPDNNNGYIATGNNLNFVWEIDNYASTTQQKPFRMYGGFNRTSVGNVGFDIYGGIFSNNAVNKITVYSDYNFNGGTIYLYGVN
jgi:hypothetical protein